MTATHASTPLGWARRLGVTRTQHRVFGGVLGGLAERWHVPAFALRVTAIVATVVFAALPGSVPIAYLVLWLILPDHRGHIIIEGRRARAASAPQER